MVFRADFDFRPHRYYGPKSKPPRKNIVLIVFLKLFASVFLRLRKMSEREKFKKIRKKKLHNPLLPISYWLSISFILPVPRKIRLVRTRIRCKITEFLFRRRISRSGGFSIYWSWLWSH